MTSRRTVLLALTALPLIAGLPRLAFAQDTLTGDQVETSEGDLTVHPVSHASLVLAWGGHVIYVDPVGGAAPYADLPKPTGILVTHGHPDHFDAPTLEALTADGAKLIVNEDVFGQLPDSLKGMATALANNTSGELSGLGVDAVPAYNTTPDRAQYHPKGVGNGYLLTLANTRVYIAGDTEDTPEMRALTDIDVAFLPMNLPYTMDINQAADAVKTFLPRIVYPYHYGDSDVEAFAELVGTSADVRLRDWYPAE